MHVFLAGLTMREAVEHPVPRLGRRLSPRCSSSETESRLPRTPTQDRITPTQRTFGDIEPWPEFRDGARQLFDSVDNTQRVHERPSSRVLPGATIDPAADEVEVRGAVVALLHSVNDIAQVLRIPVRCAGGGGERSVSFADLVLRPAGALSDPAGLSGQILGTGAVKGDWDFRLERGERLEAALHDPERGAAIVQSVQQVRATSRSAATHLGACICQQCCPRSAVELDGDVRDRLAHACVSTCWPEVHCEHSNG